MSMSGALSNALSGLTAASRAAELVSNNISNALTEGYGKRELSLSTRLAGSYGGVSIDGVTRHVDKRLLSDRREAQAANETSQISLDFNARLEKATGTPDQPTSLSARIASFEAALVSAAAKPDSSDRLSIATARAGEIVQSINQVAGEIRTLRSNADADIATNVNTLNTSLKEVARLNVRISAALNQGADTTALEDHRQTLVDRISAIVPIREVGRERGSIALFTTGGAILLDGKAGELNFTPAHSVEPHMSVENGLLSGLSLNGVPLSLENQKRAFGGGSLGALMEIRDSLAPEAQANLDAVARDLVERFESSALPGQGPGVPGLFTDAQQPFNALQETGLSLRLSLNATIDPAKGGSPQNLRNGVNGPALEIGDSSALNAMLDQMQSRHVATSGSFTAINRTMNELASEFLSSVSTQRDQAERTQSYNAARYTETKEAELADGVDTDQEMQRLLLIEQSYTANARIIQVMDELLDTLLRAV
jgi:flagellar hook-associated protein 1 FlgK